MLLFRDDVVFLALGRKLTLGFVTVSLSLAVLLVGVLDCDDPVLRWRWNEEPPASDSGVGGLSESRCGCGVPATARFRFGVDRAESRLRFRAGLDEVELVPGGVGMRDRFVTSRECAEATRRGCWSGRCSLLLLAAAAGVLLLRSLLLSMLLERGCWRRASLDAAVVELDVLTTRFWARMGVLPGGVNFAKKLVDIKETRSTRRVVGGIAEEEYAGWVGVLSCRRWKLRRREWSVVARLRSKQVVGRSQSQCRRVFGTAVAGYATPFESVRYKFCGGLMMVSGTCSSGRWMDEVQVLGYQEMAALESLRRSRAWRE